MRETFLPYGRQWIDDDDVAAVTATLQSDYLTTGPEIAAFETAFCDYAGSDHAIACNSATAALHLTYAGLGVKPGDVVVVPAITFVATANAARYCGADVVLADVDAQTGLMTPETFSRALESAGQRTKLVAPVHLAGMICDMAAISDIAGQAGVHVVEDSCHALASLDETGAPAGACTYSDAATFSFHPVKTLACGEGGMATTNNSELAAYMRRARSHGVERDQDRLTRSDGAQEPWWYEMHHLGWNYRMPDINAALGRSQLSKLALFAKRRRTLSALYTDALISLAPRVRAPAQRQGIDPCRHLYNVRIDFRGAGLLRADVMDRLRALGVGTQVHYIPLHHHPYYKDHVGELSLPGSESYYAQTLSLPLYPSMRDEDPLRVVEALASILKC